MTCSCLACQVGLAFACPDTELRIRADERRLIARLAAAHLSVGDANELARLASAPLKPVSGKVCTPCLRGAHQDCTLPGRCPCPHAGADGGSARLLQGFLRRLLEVADVDERKAG